MTLLVGRPAILASSLKTKYDKRKICNNYFASVLEIRLPFASQIFLCVQIIYQLAIFASTDVG